MISDLTIFSTAPTQDAGVRIANEDFAAVDHTGELTRFEAEYVLGMHEIDCLHCLLESQLAYAGEAVGWMSTPVMSSYVAVGEREDGMALQYDEAICVFEHDGRPYIARLSLYEPSWLEHNEPVSLRISITRSESEGDEVAHQAFYDAVTEQVHDLMASTLYWHGTMDLEEEAIRENNQVAVDALRNVVADLVAEFNEQLPEGMAASVANHDESGDDVEGDEADQPPKRTLH